MVSVVTNNIKVGVETFYQEKASNPMANIFVFAYRITIDNLSPYTVKLVRRHWFIVDGVGRKDEVEGEGVIGLQPILKPNESHIYISGCHFQTDVGKMYGYYTMEKIVDGSTFQVAIPTFNLLIPQRLN